MKNLKTQLAVLLLSALTGAYGQLTTSADSHPNTAGSTANHQEARARIPDSYGRLPPQFSGVVGGTVTFYDGTTVLKTASMKEGVAKFTTSTLTSGTHTITATYNGSTSFDPSSGSLTQTVN